MTWLLADLALRSAVTLAVAALVTWLLRGHSAALRHAVWIGALAVGVLLVPLALVRPLVSVAIYPRAIERVETVRLAGSPMRSIPVSVGPLPAAARSSGANPNETFFRIGPRLGPRLGPLLALAIPFLWLAGTMALLARIVIARCRLGELRHRARPILDARIRETLRWAARAVGVRREVELLECDELGSPAACGLQRPAVLLPGRAREWSDARLRVVLAHELAHVRRRDALTQLVAEVSRAIHWMNPLAWLAVDRLTLERERACDDEVLRAGTRSTDYAHHLLALARAATSLRGPGSALTMAESGGLHARMRALLSPSVRRSRLSRGVRVLVVTHATIVAGALTCVTGMPRPVAARVGPARLTPGVTAIATPTAAASAPRIEALRESDRTSRPLSDPLSERVGTSYARDARSRWPSDEEIESSPERAALLLLRRAAAHEPTFAHDLVGERAAWALTRVRDGRITAPLIESLADPDWRIQAYAAWSLGAIGANEAAAPVRGLLDHVNWRVRAQAAETLLQLGAGLPTERLDALARDPAWQVRICVVQSLEGSRDPAAVALLETMRDDPHTGTRLQVQAALATAVARSSM